MRIPFISLIAGSALALGGCAYGGLGLGYGGGYGSYGSYGSPYYGASYGHGSRYYGGGYGYGSSYYGGYGSPYGWYGNYYYPGSGYYVYDSYRRPYAMTTTQRQYWSTRSPALRTTTTTRTTAKPNWGAFSQRATAGANRQAARIERQTTREARRAQRRRND